MHEVGVGILGPAVVVERGRTRELGATRHRALLTVLALHRGARVGTGALIEALWGDAPPAAAATTLQGYVADLRRVLEPRRAPRTPAAVLVTEPGGYALRLDEDAVDAARFEAVVRRAAQVLPPLLPGPLHLLDAVDHRPVLADWRDELAAALGLWRGEPLCDLGTDLRAGPDTGLETGPGAARCASLEADLERDRLRALRLDAEVLRLTAALALGGHASATADLARLAGQNPWDERIWTLWATALARTGRQAEALARLRELRAALADELGLDPGPDVGVLETAILRHEVRAPAPDQRPASLPGASAAEAARIADGEPALVGRHAERALLRRTVDRATGGPELLHLTGEHGLGKSRLVREAARYAGQRGFAVVSAGCARAAVREELWAWHRLARGLREAAGRPATAGTDSPGPSPVAAAEEVLDLITGLTARRPLLLVVEDLQWADRATLVGLAHLVASRPAAPFLLLLTQRLAPVAASSAMAGLLSALGRAHGVHHALGGLAPDEVGELLAAVHAGPLGPGRVADVARRSEGNPFVVVELARHGRLPAGPLPATVRAVVTHALGGLPDPTTGLLAGASLLDPTFDPALLAEATGLEPAAVFEALAPAVAAGVLREETRYRYAFEVGVVREALAESLTPIPRARWQADLAAAAARRRGRGHTWDHGTDHGPGPDPRPDPDVPSLLPCPPPWVAVAGPGARYDRPPARMYPS